MIFLEIVLVIVLALLCLRSYFAIKRLEKLESGFNKLVTLTSDITNTLNGLLPLVETSLGISQQEVNDRDEIEEYCANDVLATEAACEAITENEEEGE